MAQPLVTVALPTYNRAHLLKRAVDSVLAQTVQDIEIIVSDNASTDDTEAVVKAFDDPRIVYLRNDTNIGHWRNETQAMHAARAPFVCVLFDDEFMRPTNLERKLAVMVPNPEVVLTHSAFIQVDDHRRVLDPCQNWCGLQSDTIETGEEFITRTFESPCRVHVASAMFRTDVARQVAFREDDKPADDHALWLQVATFGSVAYVHEPLVSFTVTAGWSSENGFMTIADGSYQWTFDRVMGFRTVLERFLDQRSYPPGREFELRAKMDEAFRHQLTMVVRQQGVRGEHPYREMARTLLAATRHDPKLWLDARFPRAIGGRARESAARSLSRYKASSS